MAEWCDVNLVLGTLQDTFRSHAMAAYRSRGGTLGALDVDAMARALTSTEDRIECCLATKQRAAARTALRALRRELEARLV